MIRQFQLAAYLKANLMTIYVIKDIKAGQLVGEHHIT